MTDNETQNRNRDLALWITALDAAMSLVADGHDGLAYARLLEIRQDMEAVAVASPSQPTVRAAQLTQENQWQTNQMALQPSR